MDLNSTVRGSLDYIFFVAVIIGLLLPAQTSFLYEYATIFLGIALFFIFLKVDFSRMLGYAKKPLLLAYIAVVFLFLIPSVFFFVTSLIDPTYAVGFLLLFGVPTAATIAALVDIFRANVSFALMIEFVLYVLSPITLPLLSFYLAGSIIAIDTFGLFITMLEMIIIPMLAAQIIKRFINTKRAEGYTTSISILMIAITGVGIAGYYSAFIITNLYSLVFFAVILYALYAVAGIATYYMAFWLERKDRLTISATKMFMNGTLALVLASQFFGPEAVLVIISNILVWYPCISLGKRFMK
jgi:BASS family bile acid:Na+ symporter